MIYKICYELIKSGIVIIALHYLFVYIKNLLMEAYVVNPIEVPMTQYIEPIVRDAVPNVIPNGDPDQLKNELLEYADVEYNGDTMATDNGNVMAL